MNWLSCRQVLEKETERLDSGRKAGFWERVGITFHVILCRTCNAYLLQVASLQAIVSRLSDTGLDSDAQIREDRRAKMREVLEKEAESCGCSAKSASSGEGHK
jgi:hypothetical protein